MKKKSLMWCLLALVFGAGLMLSSCKDNENASDHPVNPDEEALEKGSERGEALLGILSYTAGLDSLPDNWYDNGYTVEPTIGSIKDEANPYVRYVAASDAESAYNAYKNMVSEDLTGEAKKTDSWFMDGIGSLNYNVSDQSDVIATVDVNVRQLPHLTQIRFVPASALGDNSSWFSGDPYYNFGDIVLDTQEGTYWICARPNSKEAGKSTSHWVSFNLVDANFKEYKKDGYSPLVLPNALGNKSGSEEHILNFFKLLSAMTPGLSTLNGNATKFEDIKLSDVTLDKDYLKYLASKWDSYVQNELLFPGTTRDYLKTVFSKGTREDLHAFYYSHHSGKKTADVHMLTTNTAGFNYLKKEKIEFDLPTEDTIYNFRKYADTKIVSQDLNKLRDKKTNQDLPKDAFIIRYKTGYELSGKHSTFWNDYEPGQSFMQYAGNKIQDVFVSRQAKVNGIYGMGDQVVLNKDFKYICIKSASSLYLNREAENNITYFFAPVQYGNFSVVPSVAGREDVYMMMFHLMNAYLQSENLVDFSSDADYQKSLKEIWDFAKTNNDFVTQAPKKDDNNNDIVKLQFACTLRDTGTDRMFTVSYNKTNKQYTFNANGNYDYKCPRVSIYYKANPTDKSQMTVKKQSEANSVKSADEGARLYNEANKSR